MSIPSLLSFQASPGNPTRHTTRPTQPAQPPALNFGMAYAETVPHNKAAFDELMKAIKAALGEQNTIARWLGLKPKVSHVDTVVVDGQRRVVDKNLATTQDTLERMGRQREATSLFDDALTLDPDGNSDAAAVVANHLAESRNPLAILELEDGIVGIISDKATAKLVANMRGRGMHDPEIADVLRTHPFSKAELKKGTPLPPGKQEPHGHEDGPWELDDIDGAAPERPQYPQSPDKTQQGRPRWPQQPARPEPIAPPQSRPGTQQEPPRWPQQPARPETVAPPQGRPGTQQEPPRWPQQPARPEPVEPPQARPGTQAPHGWGSPQQPARPEPVEPPQARPGKQAPSDDVDPDDVPDFLRGRFAPGEQPEAPPPSQD